MAFGEHIVGTEGFILTEVDRDIKYVDDLMSSALGESASPVQRAITIARAQGAVALGDFGCGTGNALSTWRERVATEAPCELSQVTGVGVSLNDYSGYRDGDAQRIWDEPGLRYVIRDITKGVSAIEDNSIDVANAYSSVFYWKDPETGLEEVRRVMKPGGTFVFNALLPRLGLKRAAVIRRENIMSTMNRWSAEGVDVTSRRCEIITSKLSGTQLLYRATFPEAN